MTDKPKENTPSKYKRMLKENAAANDVECDMSQREMMKMMAFAAELAKRAREETLEPQKSRKSLRGIVDQLKLLFSGPSDELKN